MLAIKKILAMIWLFIPGVLMGSGIIFLVNHFLLPPKITSQLKKPFSRQAVLSATKSTKQVIGYLPFWNLKEVNRIPFDNLSLIYYFGLPAKSDGNFDKTDPGWTKMNSDEFKILKQKTKRLGITLLSLDQDVIAGVLASSSRKNRLIDNTMAVMKNVGFTDLNIDIEYVGPAPEYLIDSFTKLVSDLTEKVHNQIPGGTVTVAMYADSANKPRIYDVEKIGKIADGIVIMAYDFYRMSSIKAGPVAPLFGKEIHYYDVYSSINDFMMKSPKEKIILGVPFYGYEWPVENNQPNAFVLPNRTFGPAISSYKRTMETAKENNVSVNFDDATKSPWFSWYDKSSRSWRQVWFENERSLGLKLDMINQLDLGGLAIWALGYDGPNSDPLWNVLSDKISPLNN
jgi:spore germination protein YaaH